MLNAPIVLLREGTEQSQGKDHILENIRVCRCIGDILRTTLGPRGMDKIVQLEREIAITNDGATIMELLVPSPATGKLLVELSQTQDKEVGDGTTSIVLIACELMDQARQFIEGGASPQSIVLGYRLARKKALELIENMSFRIEGAEKGYTDMLLNVAKTALHSKLLSPVKDQFSQMIVDAVQHLEGAVDEGNFCIKKIQGGSIGDSFSIDGIAFKKTFSYAGFEQQPKKFTKPKILCLNFELELKAERSNAEVRLSRPSEYQKIVQAEWEIIYQHLDNCLATGANVVLSHLPIGDLATQYFADHNVFCAGRVEEEDLKRVASATGAHIQSSTYNIQTTCLGTCEEFEEIQIGDERWNLFKKCPKKTVATILLRGCALAFIKEAERSLHDAIMVVSRSAKHPHCIAGAGSIEIKLSIALKKFAESLPGKEQIFVMGFAKALETIPIDLARNAGMDVTATISKLLQNHHQDPNSWLGVDCINRSEFDAKANFIWEPKIIRKCAISCATELANLVLKTDETIKAMSSKKLQEEVDDVVGAGGH